MHFEVLVEDRSGSIALDILLEKILGQNGQPHSWRLHPTRASAGYPVACAPLRIRRNDSYWISCPASCAGTGEVSNMGLGAWSLSWTWTAEIA